VVSQLLRTSHRTSYEASWNLVIRGSHSQFDSISHDGTSYTSFTVRLHETAFLRGFKPGGKQYVEPYVVLCTYWFVNCQCRHSFSRLKHLVRAVAAQQLEPYVFDSKWDKYFLRVWQKSIFREPFGKVEVHDPKMHLSSPYFPGTEAQKTGVFYRKHENLNSLPASSSYKITQPGQNRSAVSVITGCTHPFLYA